MTLPASFRFLEKSELKSPNGSRNKKQAKMVKLKRGELNNEKEQRHTFEQQQRSHDVLSKYKLGQDNSLEESIEFSFKSSERLHETNQTLKIEAKPNMEKIALPDMHVDTEMKVQEENADDADDFMENSNDILRGSKFEQSCDHEDETDSNKARRKTKKQPDAKGKDISKEKG